MRRTCRRRTEPCRPAAPVPPAPPAYASGRRNSAGRQAGSGPPPRWRWRAAFLWRSRSASRFRSPSPSLFPSLSRSARRSRSPSRSLFPSPSRSARRFRSPSGWRARRSPWRWLSMAAPVWGLRPPCRRRQRGAIGRRRSGRLSGLAGATNASVGQSPWRFVSRTIRSVKPAASSGTGVTAWRSLRWRRRGGADPRSGPGAVVFDVVFVFLPQFLLILFVLVEV